MNQKKKIKRECISCDDGVRVETDQVRRPAYFSSSVAKSTLLVKFCCSTCGHVSAMPKSMALN